ncbi:tetratricopeptide repeat protein [Pedobacter psychrotolerans]|nr:tetratricopeptide repeat protein [Pedobacter psychrotolerans]GGE38684.1 hypothetical protein GCM10011413_00300 [Pedobacter psychrotolerans]
MKPLSSLLIYLLLSFVLLTTAITYSNHFQNGFHFDDSHAVENNVYIRNLSNIPLFFKDGTTSSNLPQNQSYRPVVSTTLAIDYWLGNGYNYFYFHLSSFVLFLLQGVLMFFLYKKLYNEAVPTNIGIYAALGGVALYLLHPAIAETINYVIARSDIWSTFGVVLAFVLYLYSPFCRKYYIYFLPLLLGALAKPTTVMFAPIFFFYILFFEEEMSIRDIFLKINHQKLFRLFKKVGPVFIFCLALYLFIDKFTPKTWEPGGSSPLRYLITQPFVITHYFYTLFLPTGLSADTDWNLLTSFKDIRFFIGITFIIVMLYIAWITSSNKTRRPIAFGILWFFLALIPTSSIIPLAEVLNDHRMFFPFIGLIFSVCWTLALIIQWGIAKLNQKGFQYAYVFAFIPLLLLPFYASATYERNKIWKDEESLWYDVTVKSPLNGRGLMNYGLAKMAQGDYKTASVYFERALVMLPTYANIYINMGILKAATGHDDQSSFYFKKGIEYGQNYPDTHFYYAKYLYQKKVYDTAQAELLKVLALSPSHLEARFLLMDTYQKTSQWDKLEKLAIESLKYSPQNQIISRYLEAGRKKEGELEMAQQLAKEKPSALNFLNLSLQYYAAGKFDECIDACKQAITLDPKLAEAYNNMGSAYNLKGEYQKAIPVLEKALAINPGFTLASNNLEVAKKGQLSAASDQSLGIDKSGEARHINKSLEYYNSGRFEQCIAEAKLALKSNPKSDIAYNNLCAAYNSLKEYDKAIMAGEKGIQLNPSNSLLKNNLAAAYQGKKRN